MESSFHLIDWIIVAVYLAAMAGVGIYFSRRQTSIEHYLLADRNMAWLPVGLSLMAALPFYRRLNFYTAYEYLEQRFDVRVRTLGAAIFILWRLGWMATAMYVPSLAINAATGGQVDLTTMTIVVGCLVTMYTMLGGIQAVIWNDVVQFCIMFGGLGATVAIVLANVPGGMGEIFNVALGAGKLDFWPPLVDPAAATLPAQVRSFFTQPMTVVALLVALVVGRMAQYTSD